MKFCPQCHLLLLSEDCDGVPILVCQGCGGCWFTRIALEQAISAHPRALAGLDTRFPVEPRFENYAGLSTYCPECRTTALTQDDVSMARQIPALKCARCQGVWLRSGTRLALIDELPLAVELPAEEILGAEGATMVLGGSTERHMSLPEESAGADERLYGSGSTGEIVADEPTRDYLSANAQYSGNFIHGH